MRAGVALLVVVGGLGLGCDDGSVGSVEVGAVDVGAVDVGVVDAAPDGIVDSMTDGMVDDGMVDDGMAADGMATDGTVADGMSDGMAGDMAGDGGGGSVDRGAPDMGPPCVSPGPHVGEPLAALDDCGRLTYGLYAQQGQGDAVHRLPDFSYAGYRGGGVALPVVPTVVTLDAPSGGDDRAVIQAAIDEVAARPLDGAGLRGAVLLRRGEWRVEGSLVVAASGVVLRGEGQGADGTVVVATRRAQHSVIELMGDEPALAEVAGTRRRIAGDVPVGSHRVPLDDVEGLAVGDAIAVERTPNDAWVDALDMARYGWEADAYHIAFERRVVAVEGDGIVVDLPIVDAIAGAFGGGAVYRVDHGGRVAQVGVEDLRVVSEFNGDRSDEQHAWKAVRLSRVTDSWVRGVTAVHLGYAAVSVEQDSSFNTVQDCAFLEPVSQVTGSRRYAFNLSGASTGNLFQRCYAHEARHDFVSGARTTGPNVWLDVYSANSSNDDGPHHRWATGLLFDNAASLFLHVENRADSGTGHGWSGAQVVFWNGRANGIRCDAPHGAMNFAIGCVGAIQEGGWRADEPAGWFESHGMAVAPRSLYLQQLADRLGADAVAAVTLPAQREGRVWGLLAGWAGEGSISEAVPVEERAPCEGGIAAGDVCCEAGCGACGGAGCGGRPGGADACCAGAIRAAGVSCDENPPPCVISGG